MARTVFILLLMASPSWAAIGFDGGSSGRVASSASVTYSHTVTSNSNGVIYVCTQGVQSGGAPGAVSSVTYNGTNLTRVQTQICYEFGQNCLELWRLKAPSTGSNNVVITYAGSISEIIGVSVSYTGVDQTTPEDTPVTNSDDTGSSNGPMTVNASSQTGDVVIDCASPRFAAAAATVGAGQTSRAVLDDTGSSGSWVGMSEEAGAATVTMSWTLGATPKKWATIAANLNVANTTITGCRLLQNGTDKRLRQSGADGRIFQGGGSCGITGGGGGVVPVNMLMGVGL